MLTLDIDLASVMQAGRWKTTVMPMRYGTGGARRDGADGEASEVSIPSLNWSSFAATAVMRPRIEAVRCRYGYETAVVWTPLEFMDD
jgi:hypothetical protein